MTLKADCCPIATPLLLTASDPREHLLNIIGSAPEAVRRAMCDLLLSIKTSLDVLPLTPQIDDPDRPVADWESLLGALTAIRQELDRLKVTKSVGMRVAYAGRVQLEHR